MTRSTTPFTVMLDVVECAFVICLLESSLLQDNVAFVLCLDTLGNGDGLYLHVSKPPKEGTPQYALLRELQMVTCARTHIHTQLTV